MTYAKNFFYKGHGAFGGVGNILLYFLNMGGGRVIIYSIKSVHKDSQGLGEWEFVSENKKFNKNLSSFGNIVEFPRECPRIIDKLNRVIFY